jgi:hypothetical protein
VSKWKSGVYPRPSALLLVLSEERELALVEASPDGFKELRGMRESSARPEPPGTGGDVLLACNRTEMVAWLKRPV